MLRESGKINNEDYNLQGAVDPTVDSGVEHGRELVNFASAVAGTDEAALVAARSALLEAMGSPAVVSASVIAANFSMLDRIANVIGIGLDDMFVKPSAEIRDMLGINAYPSAANTLG